MKKNLKAGDTRKFTKTVSIEDTAGYVDGFVHPVYSTFNIARDAEWSGRLFVLDAREEDEEGVGTMISVEHHAPAFPGEEVVFTSKIKSIHHHMIITTYKVRVGDRLIASGEQGQKIFKLEKLNRIFNKENISKK